MSMITDESGEAPAAPRSGGRMQTVLAVGVLTMLAAGAGAVTGTLLAAPAPAPAAAETPGAAAPAAEGGAHAEETGGGTAAPAPAAAQATLVPLKPIITNIAAPADVVVRLESALVLDGEPDEPASVLASRIEADTLTFLRSVQLAQIEGARGIAHLREDLVERARMRSPAVVDVLIQTLVAE